MTEDINVNLDAKSGKLRGAALTSRAAGAALLVVAYGVAVTTVLGVVAVPIAICFGYDIEYSLKELSFKLKAPAAVAQMTVASKKSSAKNVVPETAEKISDGIKKLKPPGMDKQVADNAATAGERGRSTDVGKPLDLTPKLEHLGQAPMVTPLNQGDEEDNPDGLPRNAFYRDGRWYIIVPYECERRGSEPMYESCSYNPKAPGGRPTIRQ